MLNKPLIKLYKHYVSKLLYKLQDSHLFYIRSTHRLPLQCLLDSSWNQAQALIVEHLKFILNQCINHFFKEARNYAMLVSYEKSFLHIQNILNYHTNL